MKNPLNKTETINALLDRLRKQTSNINLSLNYSLSYTKIADNQLNTSPIYTDLLAMRETIDAAIAVLEPQQGEVQENETKE